MMVDDVVGVRRKSELMAQHRVELNDRLAMRRCHLVGTCIEVTYVFDTDTAGVGAFDSGRDFIERTTNGDGAIGERRQVLSDLGEAPLQM